MSIQTPIPLWRYSHRLVVNSVILVIATKQAAGIDIDAIFLPKRRRSRIIHLCQDEHLDFSYAYWVATATAGNPIHFVPVTDLAFLNDVVSKSVLPITLIRIFPVAYTKNILTMYYCCVSVQPQMEPRLLVSPSLVCPICCYLDLFGREPHFHTLE